MQEKKKKFLYYPHFDAGGAEFGGHAGRDSGIGDDTVEIFGTGDEGIAALVEFGGIEYGNHLARLLDHELVHQRLLEAGRGDAMLHGERIDAEKELVACEIAQHGERQRADGRVVVGMHIAAQQDDIKPPVGDQLGGDIDGVGEDMQVVELMQMSCHLKGCGAGIEHDMIALFDEFGGFLADALFLAEIEHPLAGDSHLSVGVLHRLAHSSSARADEQVAVLQHREVLSDRDFGDTGFAAELGDKYFFLLLQLAEDERPALLG